MDDLLSAKKAIRDSALSARNGLGNTERAARSAAICSTVESIAGYASAGSILFFMPIRSEVDIASLMLGALRRGVTCALPKCSDGRSLRLFAVSDPACDLEPGMWGIPEPKECLAEYTVADFSVIMIPGAAFDRHGRRIGYGAGYYDRLLAAGDRALKIAPAFALQVLAALPYGPHDLTVDVIVTEDEIIDCRKAGGDKHG
jgi:5-formyltetrahydrofolate cyclo-ligase